MRHQIFQMASLFLCEITQKLIYHLIARMRKKCLLSEIKKQHSVLILESTNVLVKMWENEGSEKVTFCTSSTGAE